MWSVLEDAELGQVPGREARFYFTVGRSILYDDSMLRVGAIGVGAWTLLNCLATEFDGLIPLSAGLHLLKSWGMDADHWWGKLIDANLLHESQDKPGWYAITGWTKYQTHKKKPSDSPEATRERKRRSREGTQRGSVVRGVTPLSRPVTRDVTLRVGGGSSTPTPARPPAGGGAAAGYTEPDPDVVAKVKADIEAVIAQAESRPRIRRAKEDRLTD